MKAIIAGGRTYQLTPEDLKCLDQMHTAGIITSVVHGGAPGVDTTAGKWVTLRGLAVEVFRADWARGGRSAGPIRNQAMIDYVRRAGVLVVFPGGRGTGNVFRKAERAGLRIFNLVPMRY